MKNNNTDFAFIKREFDAILAYEKNLNTPLLSSTRILEYFGAENICKIYGCSIVTDRVAYTILNEVLKTK